MFSFFDIYALYCLVIILFIFEGYFKLHATYNSV